MGLRKISEKNGVKIFKREKTMYRKDKLNVIYI